MPPFRRRRTYPRSQSPYTVYSTTQPISKSALADRVNYLYSLYHEVLVQKIINCEDKLAGY